MKGLDTLEDYSWFRGLWMSRCIEDDGSISVGWSVTFVKDGQYYDMSYCASPSEAFQKAAKCVGDPLWSDRDEGKAD